MHIGYRNFKVVYFLQENFLDRITLKKDLGAIITNNLWQ